MLGWCSHHSTFTSTRCGTACRAAAAALVLPTMMVIWGGVGQLRMVFHSSKITSTTCDFRRECEGNAEWTCAASAHEMGGSAACQRIRHRWTQRTSRDGVAHLIKKSGAATGGICIPQKLNSREPPQGARRERGGCPNGLFSVGA